MSAEIIKVYKQDIPAVRFIGKKYGNNDRVDGMFGKHWGDWFQNGWFDIIVKQTETDLKTVYEDGDAYIGLMHKNEDGHFEYFIGVFMPENTSVPDGYEHLDFTKGTLGVCWVYGKEADVYMHEGECVKKLKEAGYNISETWCFERYCCPRFTTPDEKGNVILDICFYL